MRARTGVLLLTAMVALAGCGGPASPSSGGPSPSDEPSGVATTSAPTASSSSGLPTDLVSYILSGDPVSPATYVDAYDTVASFSTPSGNISCGFALADSWVTCWIDENSWPSIPKPTCEEGDWGPNWVTASDAGVKRGACTSEQPFPMPGEVLPYGSTINVSSIGCRSESTFLACANLDTGNGFVISKAIYHPYGPVIA